MRYLNNPRHSLLPNVFEQILSEVAFRLLTSGWEQLFRSSILEIMPAGELAEHFHPELGRPTQELYSMAGLIFMMEFRDWTHHEAADAYMFNVDVQYALNLNPENQSLCRRTIEAKRRCSDSLDDSRFSLRHRIKSLHRLSSRARTSSSLRS